MARFQKTAWVTCWAWMMVGASGVVFAQAPAPKKARTKAPAPEMQASSPTSSSTKRPMSKQLRPHPDIKKCIVYYDTVVASGAQTKPRISVEASLFRQTELDSVARVEIKRNDELLIRETDLSVSKASDGLSFFSLLQTKAKKKVLDVSQSGVTARVWVNGRVAACSVEPAAPIDPAYATTGGYAPCPHCEIMMRLCACFLASTSSQCLRFPAPLLNDIDCIGDIN